MSDLAYFWGEDAYNIEHAAQLFAANLAPDGTQTDSWRTSGDDDDAAESGPTDGAGRERGRILDQIEQHLVTQTLFGGGTLVVVRQPGSLLREVTSRERLLGLLARVAPGNGLCFLDLVASGAKGPAQGGVLRDAVAAHGGVAQEFPALTRERMETWINVRAKELGVSFGPGAAAFLAERVGAYVREGDVDKRRMSELANAELEKLALYRPDGVIGRDDVAELVTEAVPGSTWAFLDAVGSRRAAEAAVLVARLLADAAPMPLLITQIHRRLRDLIVIRDHLASGTRPADLVRELRLQPYRAQKLTEQARTWEQAELDGALSDLLDLDLLSKGIAADGSPHSLSEDRSQLALVAWIGDWVSRAPAERRVQPARASVVGRF
jgi:DNA polymerase III delta subunit